MIVGPIATRLVQSAGQRARTATELRDNLLACVPEQVDQERFLKACGDIFPGAPAPESCDTTETTLAPKPKPAPQLEAAVLEQARKNLAIQLGPMAKVLVKRAAAKAKNRAELYPLLAAEISSAKDREVF